MRDRPGDEVAADEVIIVVEILAPGTRLLDRVTKRSEYATAGIPHYWIVDLDAGPSIEPSPSATGPTKAQSTQVNSRPRRRSISRWTRPH
ncbi:Uma2 family endonuclease [Tsukamurella pseudospumae]|uniref:Uma2 family endonuclease n=1 Tax=Tsukamurella pseudospumae TaxID=239498 RepID=UPI003CC8094D